MKKLKKILALTMATALMSMGLVGCGTDTTASQAVVATVDGTPVTEGLYRTYLWSAQQLLEQISGPTIWDMELEGRSTEDWAKENALESVTLAIITERLADEMSIELDRETKNTIKNNAKGFKEANAEVLSTYGFTQNEVEAVLASAELSERVKNKMMDNYVPTEEDIQKFIDENKEQFKTVTAKHVLIQTVDAMGQALPEEEVAERKELAEEILAKALAGEDMAELAKEYSEDPGSKDKGGEYTFARGEMVPEFEKASFDGKDGEVWPELVETSYGYHIIKTEAHHEADEDMMREQFIEYEKMNYVNTETIEMIENAVVEKTDLFEAIKIIRADQNEEGLADDKDEADDETTEEDTSDADNAAEETKNN